MRLRGLVFASLTSRQGLYRGGAFAFSAASSAASSAQDLLRAALGHHQAGRLTEAVDKYEALIDALGGPLKVPTAVLSNRGAALLGLNRIEEAEESWRQALEVDPAHAEAHLNLAVSLQGDALVSPGRLARAKEHASEALKLRPGYGKAHQALANALQNQALGESAAAEQQWRLAELAETSAKTAAGQGAVKGGDSDGAASSSKGDGGGARKEARGEEWPRPVPGFVPLRAGAFVPCPATGLEVQALSLPSSAANSNPQGSPQGSPGAAPLVLRVPDFLTEAECTRLIAAARPNLQGSYVVGSPAGGLSAGGAGAVGARSSQSTWVGMGSEPWLGAIRARAAALLGLDLKDFIRRAEDLQVVRYRRGEEFGLHHDASARFQRRLFTLLIYLNDLDEPSQSPGDQGAGGETYFPFAAASPPGEVVAGADASGGSEEEEEEEEGDTSSAPWAGLPDSRQRLEIALKEGQKTRSRLGESKKSGDLGLRVAPRRGTALLFFNLDLRDGEPDPAAVHASLPLRSDGEKWVANFWISA